jgi:hypothetical protein
VVETNVVVETEVVNVAYCYNITVTIAAKAIATKANTITAAINRGCVNRGCYDWSANRGCYDRCYWCLINLWSYTDRGCNRYRCCIAVACNNRSSVTTIGCEAEVTVTEVIVTEIAITEIAYCNYVVTMINNSYVACNVTMINNSYVACNGNIAVAYICRTLRKNLLAFTNYPTIFLMLVIHQELVGIEIVLVAYDHFQSLFS